MRTTTRAKSSRYGFSASEWAKRNPTSFVSTLVGFLLLYRKTLRSGEINRGELLAPH